MKYGFDSSFVYQPNGIYEPHISRRNVSASYPESLNFPPYAIRNGGPTGIISDKTVHVDILHANGLLEYDVHNLYGTSKL